MTGYSPVADKVPDHLAIRIYRNNISCTASQGKHVPHSQLGVSLVCWRCFFDKINGVKFNAAKCRCGNRESAAKNK